MAVALAAAKAGPLPPAQAKQSFPVEPGSLVMRVVEADQQGRWARVVMQLEMLEAQAVERRQVQVVLEAPAPRMEILLVAVLVLISLMPAKQAQVAGSS